LTDGAGFKSGLARKAFFGRPEEAAMHYQLSEEYERRLDLIRAYVRNLWQAHTGPPWFTFHDASHNQKVEEMLFKIIPADKVELLSQEEWFYLLAAAWLHDLGMILSLFGTTDDFTEVRNTHHERSFKYVWDNRKPLGLSPHEARIITSLIRYHRKVNDIYTCDEKIGEVRVRLLAAYLRLADALHIDASRTSEARYQLLLAVGMPWESRFHWLKSMWVISILPHAEKLSITASVADTPTGSPRQGLLPRLVKNELLEELNSIRDVLIRGQIAYFLDVQVEAVTMPNVVDDQELVGLEQVLSNIELVNLSSASDVANCIIGTVLRLAEMNASAYEAIREYCKQLEDVINARPCHNMLHSLYMLITSATAEEKLSDELRQSRVEKIKIDLRAYQETRRRNIALIAENARPFLLDGGSILLFGFSSLNLAALKSMPDALKEITPIYIAECRGKTQYSTTNEVYYCDGLKYAEHVRGAGLKNVTIVPDICTANLMSRSRINKVLFGANGVDLKGNFGHTAGHLAIALMAQAYHIPVYVIADTSKFGDLPFSVDIERPTQWLTRDPRVLKSLAEQDIHTSNPREDLVDPSKVSMLITEVGAFRPEQIMDLVERKIIHI
jgi:translation initiation factor 2B subunit (eIF-2B alpha/beta/delta family)